MYSDDCSPVVTCNAMFGCDDMNLPVNKKHFFPLMAYSAKAGIVKFKVETIIWPLFTNVFPHLYSKSRGVGSLLASVDGI